MGLARYRGWARVRDVGLDGLMGPNLEAGSFDNALPGSWRTPVASYSLRKLTRRRSELHVTLADGTFVGVGRGPTFEQARLDFVRMLDKEYGL
jgi:hypothetical protein